MAQSTFTHVLHDRPMSCISFNYEFLEEIQNASLFALVFPFFLEPMVPSQGEAVIPSYNHADQLSAAASKNGARQSSQLNLQSALIFVRE